MCGSTSEEKPADADIQVICNDLQGEAMQMARDMGWGRLETITDFVAISFLTQVVAGKNIFVKIKVTTDRASNSKCWFMHIRIFQPLPHTHQPPKIVAIQLYHSESAPLLYFEESSIYDDEASTSNTEEAEVADSRFEESTKELSDAEFIAQIEAQEAEEFRLAVEAWRLEKANGGGDAVIVETGGDFCSSDRSDAKPEETA